MAAPTTQFSTTQSQPHEGSTTKIIGDPVSRVDGPSKVTGKARYAADFPLKGSAVAVLVQSTISAGRVKSINRTEAAKSPGVLAILTSENMPRLHRVSMDSKPGQPGQTYLPLQDDQVHYAGQYVAMVIAERLSQAMHAAQMVTIAYEETAPVLQVEDAMHDAFVPSKMGRSDKATYERGKPEDGLSNAVLKIEQTYRTAQQNHHPIEMSATTAVWNGDQLTLYNATQHVYGSRAIVSIWLGIPEENIRVIDPYVGGGFGCKGSSWPHEVLAAVAAKTVKRPVKLVLTRQQMATGVGYRPATTQAISLGADGDGKLLVITHDCVSQTSISKDEWVETSTKQTRMLYFCPNLRTGQKLVPINANTPTQMRAPGHATGTFALEVAMDELATAGGFDPVEVRLLNYAEKDEEENLPFSSKELKECYRQGADRFGWSKRNPKVASNRAGNSLVGYGMATAVYPTNQEESNASVEIRPDGTALVKTAAHDLGTGAYTILTQIASQTLGIPLEKIQVRLGDSDLPMAPVAGGSQTSASVGSAVQVAAEKAVAQLKERAAADPESPLSGAKSKEISVANGNIFLTTNSSKGETIASLLQRNGSRPISVKGSAAPSSKAGSQSPVQNPEAIERYSKNAFGAVFAEVHIDADLRQIRVPRLVGAFAAGKILNAKTAHSQIMGGMVWGLSMALLEQTIHDPRTGRVLNDNLADYLVPVNPDILNIDCFFVDEVDKVVNPLGAKGIGELGVTGVAAAVSNAVYNASGIRVRDLPITLDKLLV